MNALCISCLLHMWLFLQSPQMFLMLGVYQPVSVCTELNDFTSCYNVPFGTSATVFLSRRLLALHCVCATQCKCGCLLMVTCRTDSGGRVEQCKAGYDYNATAWQLTSLLQGASPALWITFCWKLYKIIGGNPKPLNLCGPHHQIL